MAEGENRIIRRRLVGSWLSTVISISLVLLLIGVASLLLVNARGVADYFKENMQVSVLLRQEVEDEDGARFQAVLDSMVFVKSTRLVTKEQGIREMSEMLGEDFLSVFESAPVPVSVDVTLKAGYVFPDSLSVVRDAIAAFPEVDEVVYQQSLLERLSASLLEALHDPYDEAGGGDEVLHPRTVPRAGGLPGALFRADRHDPPAGRALLRAQRVPAAVRDLQPGTAAVGDRHHRGQRCRDLRGKHVHRRGEARLPVEGPTLLLISHG